MDSFFARNRLSSYLDRALPKDEAAEVAEAIARDTRLSADFDALRHTLDLLHADGMCSAPTGFQARVLTAVEALPPAGSQIARLRSWFDRLPAEMLALVVALIVVGLALQQRSSPPAATQEIAAAVTPEPVSAATSTPPEPVVAPVPDPTPSPSAPVAPPEKPAKTPEPTRSRTPVPASLPYDSAAPLAYRILHGGDQVLYDISALADDTGGRLLNMDGQLFRPHSLHEARSFSQLYLVTSIDNAASAHAKLLQRSGMEPRAIDEATPPIGENEAIFLIEVQL